MRIIFHSGAVLDWARHVMNRNDDSTSPELKASAVLVVGNMARNGTAINCVYSILIIYIIIYIVLRD